MPNPVENNTQIPAARVTIIDALTNYVSREWYRFFYNLYVSVENGRRYGSYYDTTTQVPADVNTPYEVSLNSVFLDTANAPIQYGVYRGADTAHIYVDNTGTYNFQFSIQVHNTAAGTKHVSFWADVNGTSVDNTATTITMTGSAAEATVAAWNFMLKLNRGDYFRLMWATTNKKVELHYEPATAIVPAVPSVILTVSSIVGG